jgi:hypothetical protein
VIDTVVPEPASGAHLDPDYAALLLRNFIVDALVGLNGRSASRLVDDRYRKFRHLGQQNSDIRDAVAREIEELQEALGQRIQGILPRGLPRRRREGQRVEAEAGEPIA